MTSLRTMWGVDIDFIKNSFGHSKATHFLKSIDPYVNDGRVNQKSNVFNLSDKGKLFADGISAELFL